MKNYITQCLLWQTNRAHALFKKEPKDFFVNEVLNWNFKGHGEHIFLCIEKTDCNTVWVAKQLARFYGVPPRDVGYSGLKDRHAVTRQYFSIRLPGVKPNSYELPIHDEYRVISHTLHDKKLKRGNHAFNDFIITLHQVKGDENLIDQRLSFIRDNGCPNLFDTQRFGNDDSNLTKLRQWVNNDIDVRKRNEKSLLLSAMRSVFFNAQLAKRIRDNTWNHLLPGDVVLLEGSNSFFVADNIDDTLQRRALEKDLHPAGLLVGAKDNLKNQSDLDENRLSELLRREHMESGYRSLRLNVKELTWQFTNDKTCTIKMRLPKGAYASGVIRQLFEID